MKLDELIIAIVLWTSSIAGAWWLGMGYQSSLDKAKDAEIKQTIEDTLKKSRMETADAISKIVVRNTTVQGKVETIVRDNTVYRDCQHTPDQLQNLNEVLTGRTKPNADHGMP